MSVRRFASAPHGGKICLELEPALETLHKLAAAQGLFELVFIDAEKTEYVQYFKILLDGNLLAPNGFICVDNTLLPGQVFLPQEAQAKNGEAIAPFNRIVKDDPRTRASAAANSRRLDDHQASVGKQGSQCVAVSPAL